MILDRDRPKRRRWVRQVLGIAISAGCLALVVRRIDFAEVERALAQTRWQYLALGLASLAFGYATRVQRWSVMLRAAGARVSGVACAAPFVGSVALNNVLPFRTGDVVRAFVFPTAIGVRRVTATASIVLERILDLQALLMVLGIGLALTRSVSPAAFKGGVAILSILCGTGLAAAVIFSRPIARVISRATAAAERRDRARLAAGLRVGQELMEGLAAMSRPGVLARVFLLSILVWLGEAGLFLALLTGLDLATGATAALVIMAVATLSTLVPSSPGYVGPFHLAAYSAVAALGATSAQAASFAILAHLALWVPTTLAGVVAILANGQLFRGTTRPAPY